MPRAVIGADCNLSMGVFVDNGVRIGDRVKIQNNVSVYDGVELEDDVFCGPSVVFTNVLNPRAYIERKHEFRRTLVRRGATLGANSTIVCGWEIGEYAFVGAGAVVASDIPAYALAVGSPARRVGWTCNCGVRLHPESEESATFICDGCGAGYVEEDGDLRPESEQ
jgi:UDP-2-acetamido-3-amino-2,3-dideoxy-glucuronate N-acetyltransferase